MANQDLINQANALYETIMVKREAANAILSYEELHNKAGSDLMDLNNGLFQALSDASVQKLIDGAPAFWAEKNGTPALGLANRRYADMQQRMMDGHPVTVEELANAKAQADAETMHNDLSAQRDLAVAAAKAELVKRRVATLKDAKEQLPVLPSELKDQITAAKAAIDQLRQTAKSYDVSLNQVITLMRDGEIPERRAFNRSEDLDEANTFVWGSTAVIDGQSHTVKERRLMEDLALYALAGHQIPKSRRNGWSADDDD